MDRRGYLISVFEYCRPGDDSNYQAFKRIIANGN